MKTMRWILAVAGVAALAGAAWAGGCCDGGFSCRNQCPLAQKASQMRSYGTEGPAAVKALANQVEKNLARI